MLTIQKIKKRSGDIVDFDLNKIQSAIQKAFQSGTVEVNEYKLQEMADQVMEALGKSFHEKTPSVEDVQDTVEKVLMQNGFFEIAKAYILYRHEHEEQREQRQQEVLEKIQHHELHITKSNGEKVEFDLEKLKSSIQWATKGYEHIIDLDYIAKRAQNNLYEGIETKEVTKAVIFVARAHIEKDPAYSHFASRLLLDMLRKEVVGPAIYDPKNLEAQYKEAFIKNIKEGVSIKRLDEKMLEYDLEKVAEVLKPERDDLFQYLGLQTLYDRYFLRNPETDEILETPQAFWLRVAMGLAQYETEEAKRMDAVNRFYEVISTLHFVPSTPTLFHSGTAHPQLSSCYLTTVDDSLDHIFKCLGDNAQLSKWSGGLGNDWTNLRATNALIKGTGVQSQGVIPFLKIANDTTVAINRSGKRRGATCAYLETWHLDIEDFLELRKNTGDERRRAHDMNTANWIPDLFMQRVRDDGQWTLFSPDDTPDLHHIYGSKFRERYEHYERQVDEGTLVLHKRVKARDLWKKMLGMLFETGHPWITFKDPCNVRSPQDHVGVVHSSNLCTEITLNTSDTETAVCNLGSINMAKHVTNEGVLDKEKMEKTVTVAMEMLDNVIDMNFYPTKEAKNSNFKHRPVGLGVMGFQDALYKMDISFDSEEAVEFADESMELVSYHAILSSSYLAKERGAYETYKGSKWDRGLLPVDTIGLLEQERGEKIPVNRNCKLDWAPVRESIKLHGMRNSNCMAVAPTATISNIAGCTPTIEPIYKNIYVKSNMSGEFTIVNSYLVEDLKKINLWNEDIQEDLKRYDGDISQIPAIPEKLRSKYKEVFDIDTTWLIKIAAHRGKWIDQSQSLNIFLKGTSGKKLSETYLHAWEMGLKTTYYLRSLGASSIEKSSIALDKKQEVPTQTIEQKDAEVKACLLNDPECEACQ